MNFSNNPHANKKQHLKPALILCGVMLAIILVMYISSQKVNKNVAENMTGYMLYTADGGKLYLYDFNEHNTKEIADGADGAGFMTRDSIFIIKDNTLSLFHSEEGREEEIVSLETGRILETDYSDSKKTTAVLWESESCQGIDIIDAEGKTQKNLINDISDITSICFSADGKSIYFAQDTDSGSCIYALSVSGRDTQKIIDVKDVSVTGTDLYENTLYLSCTDNAVYKLNLKTERLSKLEFCSDEYSCRDLCVAYETQYLVVSDKDGSKAIYVCNGSNMDKADLEHDKIIELLDYIND